MGKRKLSEEGIQLLRGDVSSLQGDQLNEVLIGGGMKAYAEKIFALLKNDYNPEKNHL